MTKQINCTHIALGNSEHINERKLESISLRLAMTTKWLEGLHRPLAPAKAETIFQDIRMFSVILRKMKEKIIK